MEGELELLVEGKPPVKYKAGDSFVVPEGAVHDKLSATSLSKYWRFTS
jgi:quercetin dioxygenase-like cupin family protein